MLANVPPTAIAVTLVEVPLADPAEFYANLRTLPSSSEERHTVTAAG